MKDDPKACANKALVASGMDPENFRTGHTKVTYPCTEGVFLLMIKIMFVPMERDFSVNTVP